MSIIAGAVGRGGAKLPDGLRDSLAATLSRTPGDVVEAFGNEHWFLAKIDLGAFKSNGCSQVAGERTLVVAGEPLLAGDLRGHYANREAEVRALFDALACGRHHVLIAATGPFCGAYYDVTADRLLLIADKLALRPIYYVVTPRFTVFASALRILEATGVIPPGLDLRGTYETAAFGFPFGERTCYEHVRTIGPAQIVVIDSNGPSLQTYFRWDRLPYRDEPKTELVARLVTAFEDGVERRRRGDKAVLAFLSGGLDSRAIVSALRKQMVEVYTLNFAPEGAQDRVFATLAAASLKSRHHQLEVPASKAINANRQEHLQEWVEQARRGHIPPERPSLIWSGDGGSVGLGHVYMNDDAVGRLDAKDIGGGIDAFLRYNRLPGASNAVMTRPFRQLTRDWHAQSVRSELEALDRELDGRSLYLFLMFNDQRRHLAKHFENIDLHRFEFLVPFFDSEFLEAVARAPVAPFLRHELYIEWLKSLCPAAVEIPWQAYPNHVPCPVPFPEGLRYQWRHNYFGWAEEGRLARNQGKEGMRLLFNPQFPVRLVNRRVYAAAVIASLAGSNAYAHLTRVGSTFARAAVVAGAESDCVQP